MSTGKRFAVYFEGKCDWYGTKPEVEIKGYYAQSQPNYEWSFTDDINKAKLWKTEKAAEKKIDHQKICSYRTLKGKVVDVDVEEMKIKQ